MFMVLSVMDYVAVPDHFRDFLGHRITAALLLVGIYFLGGKLKGKVWPYVLAYTAIALSAVTIEHLILELGGHDSSYYVGMILLAICIVTFIPAQWKFHLGSLSLIYLVYLLPILISQHIADLPVFYVSNFFMISCFAAAFVASFFIWRLLVRDYGHQYDLELEKSRSERQLSENLPGIVYRLNIGGGKGMEFFNDMLKPITGYTEDELKKGDICNIDSLILPEDHEGVVKKVRAAIARRESFEVEYRIVRKDGEIRYCLERGRPVTGIDGSALHIYGIILDITDRNRAEMELRDGEERYRRLVESAPDVVLLFDAETLRIEDVNPAATKLFGYSKEEFLSMTPVDLSAEKELTRQNMEKLRDPEFTSIEVKQRKHIKKDGTEFYGDIKASACYSNGRKKVIGAMRDVTERMRAEEERKELEHMYHQAQKLEALSELSGGISHDFNNLLAIILNNLELARMQGLDSVSGYLDKAFDAVQKGRGLVSNLLNFSRGMVVEPEVVNLGELTEGILNFMKKALEPGTDVEVNTMPGLWNVYGNPSQLQQVVMNLYQNAREAVSENSGTEPHIVFSLDNVVSPRAQSGGGHGDEEEFVRLRVADNGCGMDKETMSRIFEPFFSTKRTSNRGVGLSAVYGIIKRIGGWIDVESKPGVGTTFSIYLPRYSGAIVPTRMLIDKRIAGGSEKVLVVDDERQLADSAAEMLDALGYEVLVAYTGDEAVNILKDKPGGVDLVVTDILMPGMAVENLIGKIREISPKAHVIITSGNMESRVFEGIPNLGFLPKPYTLEALSSTVRDALGEEHDAKGLTRHLQKVKLYSVKEESLLHSENITSAKAIYKLFKHIAHESREKFIAVFLDTKKRIIAYDELTQGTFNEVVVHAQEVMRSALLTNAAGIILVHNHPSGDVEPSAQDIEMTSRMVESCKMFNIEFLDHIIIGKDGYFSFSMEESSR